MSNAAGWIGVDFDGTLARYDGWKGPGEFGEPIPEMVERVNRWLSEGRDVRIFTARVYTDGSPTRNIETRFARHAIAAWCDKHLGRVLPITCTKDFDMIELWDDRAVTVEANTGRPLAPRANVRRHGERFRHAGRSRQRGQPVSKKTYAFVIEPSEHAELSASSAERWMTCPGSVALSAGVPNTSTEFAAQGTAAHYIGAECLKDGGSPQRWLGKVALVEGHEIELDEELIEAVQEYLDDCRADTEPGDVIFVEQSFTAALKRLHPKFGGSGDRVRWRPSTRQLRVTDYKHGAGVPVDVDDNKQLKVYALGALLANPAFNAEEIELRIAQPRCDHEAGRFRSYKFPAFDLIDYAGELVAAAQKTEEFGADLVSSKKACKFCPAAAARKCPAIEKEMHALVVADFSPVALERYSPTQIAEFLAKAPLVEAAISSVREFAYNRACAGENFPGFKIVAKRATRKWSDEEAAQKAFGAVPGALTAPELRSPAQIEKLIGKKKFAAQAAALVSKESSGLTLAPVDDPRPPAQVAQLTDFNVVPENVEK